MRRWRSLDLRMKQAIRFTHTHLTELSGQLNFGAGYERESPETPRSGPVEDITVPLGWQVLSLVSEFWKTKQRTSSGYHPR